MTKFYSYGNATRRLKSGKFTFSFDVVGQFGGNWQGVLRLEDEEQITALEGFATRLGVVAITEDEYNELLKKKLNFRPSSPDIIQPSMSALKGHAAVAVIKSPLSPTIPDKTASIGTPSVELADAIVLGDAPYVDPLSNRSKSRKKKN